MGCGDDGQGHSTPYRLGQAIVIGENEGGILTSVDRDCDTPECDAVLERCGAEAFADVILDEGGAVVDVVCYKRNVTLREVGIDAVASARVGNNTVLVLDAEDDGADVTGDVTIDGNNAVIYGEGAAVSVIGGLVVEKNNAIIRGVTIEGNVTIEKNNAKLTFCDIQGDLTITGNNTTVAECVVHGLVSITGNNTLLVQSEFQGVASLEGKNLTCNANRRFDDGNEDLIVDEAELAGIITCAESRSEP
jgi:hypothetical protein